MNDTKLDPEDLDSPCQSFVRSLGFVVALAVP